MLLLYHGLTYRRHEMNQWGFAEMIVPSIEAIKKLLLIIIIIIKSEMV